MSEFQIGLVAIGVLVVLCVLVYNKLQERSARRDAEAAFRTTHVDVLLDEPGPAARREPTLDVVSQEPPRARAADGGGGALPDERLDYVIELASPEPVSANTVSTAWAPLERRFAPRALIVGASANGAWRRLDAHDPGSCTKLRAALQLVSRAGVAGEADLLEFRAQVESLAAGLGATIAALPEMKTAMEAARELDAFCAEHDIQAVIHLVAPGGGALQGTRIRASAEAAGLRLEDDGRFSLRDDEGRLVYTLGDRSGAPFTADTIKQSAPQALTLAIDVPRAPGAQRSFESMARLAGNLASVLGAELVDDNGRVLDERSLAAIAAQLESMRKSMETRGIEPGGALALRLFS